MNTPVSYNNPYAYRFNNNVGSLKNNLEPIVPLPYISFYKVKDKMILFPDTLHLQINQSVARKYK